MTVNGRSLDSVAVIGGGTMGREIAALCAGAGFVTFVKEADAELAGRVSGNIRAIFQRWLDKGKITQDQFENYNQLVIATDNLDDIQTADLVIEAVPENMDLKKQIFAELDGCMPEHTVFASNTSAFSITEMAEATRRQDRFAGLHFFNPPIKMPLVEVISGEKTNLDTAQWLRAFAAKINKRSIHVKKDRPGFVVNRILTPYLNEAARLLRWTKLTIQEIDDEATRNGWPMGPFELLDMIGLDVAAPVATYLHSQFGDRMEPAPLMAKMVRLNRLGRKNGTGFYGDPPIIEVIERSFSVSRQVELSVKTAYHQMLMALVNEAFLCLGDGISSAEDIETGCLFGIGFPMATGGPLHWAEKQGLPNIVASLARLEEIYGARFMPSRLLREYTDNRKQIFADATW